MKAVQLAVTGRGRFVVPSGNNRRFSFSGRQTLSTSGKGLLLSDKLGGFGVSETPKQYGYVSPPQMSSSLQRKLQELPVKSGLGVNSRKKKLINLKF